MNDLRIQFGIYTTLLHICQNLLQGISDNQPIKSIAEQIREKSPQLILSKYHKAFNPKTAKQHLFIININTANNILLCNLWKNLETSCLLPAPSTTGILLD